LSKKFSNYFFEINFFVKIIILKDGALGIVGPDMHPNGEYMDMNNFNIFLVTQKGCDFALNLTLNNELMSKRYDCVCLILKNLSLTL